MTRPGKQHSTKQQLYGHLPPISQAIHVNQGIHIRNRWGNKDELISVVLPWNPIYGDTKKSIPFINLVQALDAV